MTLTMLLVLTLFPTIALAASPWTATFSVSQLNALGCTLYQDVEIHSYDSHGTFRPYMINGYRLKDILQALGADISAVTNASTLLTTASDNYQITIPGSLITANESYLAMEYAESHTPGAAKSASRAPRLFPAANLVDPTDTRVPGSPPVAIGTFVDYSLCNSNIVSFTLTYDILADAPILTAGTATRTNATKAMVTFYSDKAGEYAYLIKEVGDIMPTSIVLSSIDKHSMVVGENTISVATISNKDEKVCYIIGVSSNKESNILAINIPAYSSPSSDDNGGTIVNNSTINPQAAAPIRDADGKHDDVVITLTANDNTLKNLVSNNNNLVKDIDYTVDGNKITIKGLYLDTLTAGEHTITFDMNQGADPKLTITISEESWQNPFIDVNKNQWFYEDVAYVVENGLFNGTSNNTFSPNMSMTRGMLVTVLGRLAGIDTEAYSGASFEDVDIEEYYAPYIKWAAEMGIVNGTGNDIFAPNTNITRQDLAVILYRYAEKMGITLQQTLQNVDFTDSDNIAGYAAEAVEAMVRAGVINGRDNGSFDPTATATRAEVAAMLHRFCEAIQ